MQLLQVRVAAESFGAGTVANVVLESEKLRRGASVSVVLLTTLPSWMERLINQ